MLLEWESTMGLQQLTDEADAVPQRLEMENLLIEPMNQLTHRQPLISGLRIGWHLVDDSLKLFDAGGVCSGNPSTS